MSRNIGLVVVFILFAGVASAAGRSNTPPKGLDWSGVWLNNAGVTLTATGGVQLRAPEVPPLKPEFEKRRQEVMRAMQAGKPIEDSGASCKWPGVPTIIRMTMPQEFIVLPDRVVILYENMSQVRRIFMDGRKPPADLDYTYNGFSTGHWEGDTLVAETVGLRADTFLTMGVRHSEQLKVVERYREISPGLIEVDITMTDPAVLTAPWNTKGRFRRQEADFPMLEYDCNDNNRNGVGADGTTFTLGPDGKPL